MFSSDSNISPLTPSLGIGWQVILGVVRDVPTFALGDVALVGLSAAFAMSVGRAVEAWRHNTRDPLPSTRMATVTAALVLTLWGIAGPGPPITLSALLGLLLVCLLTLPGTEVVVIVWDPLDDRDPTRWMAAVVVVIALGGVLALAS